VEIRSSLESCVSRSPKATTGYRAWGNLVAGSWREAGDGATLEVHEPATGDPLGSVPDSTPEDVGEAVEGARRAYHDEWRHRSARERGQCLLRIANAVRDAAGELATLEARDVGKPIEVARTYDVPAAADTFEYFGGLADKVSGEYFAQGPINTHTVMEPVGVVGAILPFNWPPVHVAGKAGPALAAGNTVVLKTAEQAPLSALRIVELMQSFLPPGVVSVVSGRGAAGAALAAHPGIGALSFTGSTRTGRAVLHGLADNLTPALLELGGKNPLVVFADADLELALRGAVEGMFFNQGEACSAASRIVVHEAIADRFLGRFAPAVANLAVGDPLAGETAIGPMVSAEQRARVLDYVELGKAEGAQIIAEGRLPEDVALRNGYFVAPVVFDRVDPGMRIVQEEIFGPVCVVQRFSTYDEAIELANGTEFGLIAAVYSEDPGTLARASQDLEAGVVMLNNYSRAFLGSPFGGMKASGYGREHAQETVRAFMRAKSVRTVSGRGHPSIWPPARDV
jgi:acyl-CoA reductase-like NAD-dependent aldehyde dehydrogenase